MRAGQEFSPGENFQLYQYLWYDIHCKSKFIPRPSHMCTILYCVMYFWGIILGTGFLNKFTILTVIVVLDNLEYKEVMMAGGGIHTVPITIEKYGTAIAWEFNMEPKGIAFGIIYKR